MQTQRKTLNFEGENIYVGIEHLKNWYVAILTEHLEHKRFRMDPSAETLYKYLCTHFPGGVYYSVYEAGFCGLSAHNQLTSFGITNMVVNPSDVPTSDKEHDRKTDAVDAYKLARSLRNKELTSIYIHHQDTLKDRSLLRIRKTIVEDMTRVKNKIKGMLYYYGVSYPAEFALPGRYWSNRFMNWLKEEVISGGQVAQEALSLLIEEYEERRRRLLKTTQLIRSLSRHEKYRENISFLCSVSGIGILTGMFLLVNIEDISRFANRDKFASYLGLRPTCHQSDSKDPKGHLTNRGQKELRTLLVESAWIAARKDPALSLKFNQLRHRMEANKAIIYIARKLANRIYYVLKNKQYYVNGLVE